MSIHGTTVYLSNDGDTFHELGKITGNVDGYTIEQHSDGMTVSTTIEVSESARWIDENYHGNLAGLVRNGIPEPENNPEEGCDEAPEPDTVIKVAASGQWHSEDTYRGPNLNYIVNGDNHLHIYNSHGREIAFHVAGSYTSVRIDQATA